VPGPRWPSSPSQEEKESLESELKVEEANRVVEERQIEEAEGFLEHSRSRSVAMREKLKLKFHKMLHTILQRMLQKRCVLATLLREQAMRGKVIRVLGGQSG
jgi:hypothetical protein